MFYQLLVHNTFTDPSAYSKAMEENSALIQTSSAYATNKDLIDEYVELEAIFTVIFNAHTKMTKFVSDDGLEQVTQIECTHADSALFREHPLLPRFQELRAEVGVDILKYLFTEKVDVTETETKTFASYAEARAHFPD